MYSCSCGRNLKSPGSLLDHKRSTGHCYCQRCDKFFAHNEDLGKHDLALHSSFSCGTCKQEFSQLKNLQSHQRSMTHCYCRLCNRYFDNQGTVRRHYAALHEHPCQSCSQVFKTLDLLHDHQRSTSHCYCLECDRYFVNPEAIAQHLKSSIHVSQFHCCDCDRDFVDQQALEQHLRDKIHSPQESDCGSNSDSYECHKCQREFLNETALKQHLASLVHNPLSNIRCVASSKCKARFTSPSALLHHLESGGCRSGMDRKKLNHLVQSNDNERIISSGLEEKDLLMTPIVEPDLASSSNYPLLTPLSSGYSTPIYTPFTDDDSGVPLPTASRGEPDGVSLPSGLLTPQSELSPSDLKFHLSTRRILCPLCPPNAKSFGNISALQDHLASPKHAPKNFHCPTNLLPLVNINDDPESLIKNFSTLSGLTQHIESGACHGGDTTLKRAIEFVEKRLMEMGFRQVKLLK